jgi:16S rRNA (guanine966-N2)-methyltransferase
MRIIAGTHRGRTIETPDWPGLRPTSDKLRETLFNILAPKIAGASMLDACAGSGAVGLEALSRGAAHVTFVERDLRAVRLIERNVTRCGMADRCAIIRADLGHTTARVPHQAYDLIFLDPPYDTEPEVVARVVGEWLHPEGSLIVEHARRRTVPERIDGLRCVRHLLSGDSALGFYVREPGQAGTPPAEGDE